MPVTFTKAQATKLLSAPELKLFEESRMHTLRSFSASQIDRRIMRARELRDRARDLLQRQRVVMQRETGSKRGAGGTADQQRSKDKATLLADILKRFEGQLVRARKSEAAGNVPKSAPRKHVTRKAAKTRRTAPNKDFTPARMASRKRDAEEAGEIMRARKSTAKTVTTGAATTKRRHSESPTTKTPTAKVAKKTGSKKTAVTRPTTPRLDGETAGKRTRNLKALAESPNLQTGYPDGRARKTAQASKLESARLTPIQAHISSRGRRNQGKRDQRG